MLTAILVLAFLLFFNGVFAMAELAVMTSRHSRLQQAANAGSRSAAAALALAREPTRFLSTVQVGITLIGVLAGAYAERALSGSVESLIARLPWVSEYSDSLALVLVVLVITYFSLVLGELVPKRIAIAFPETVASLIARPLALLSRIVALPVRILTVSTEAVMRVLRVPTRRADDLSEDDVKALLSRAASTGVFDPSEQRLFQRLFRASDLRVAELMVPRAEIVWIPETATAREMRVLVGTSPYSHFPVCRGGIDRIVGVVHIKDLIAFGLLAGAEFSVRDVAREPLFVPENTPALRVLDTFRERRSHIAFVVNEYGGIEGLVTINDIVRALIGDIVRRGDPAPARITRRADGSWLLDGAAPFHQVAVALEIPASLEAEHPTVNTVAGLVLALSGHFPARGESVEWAGYRFEVTDAGGTRIEKVVATRLGPDEEAGPTGTEGV